MGVVLSTYCAQSGAHFVLNSRPPHRPAYSIRACCTLSFSGIHLVYDQLDSMHSTLSSPVYTSPAPPPPLSPSGFPLSHTRCLEVSPGYGHFPSLGGRRAAAGCGRAASWYTQGGRQSRTRAVYHPGTTMLPTRFVPLLADAYATTVPRVVHTC